MKHLLLEIKQTKQYFHFMCSDNYKPLQKNKSFCTTTNAIGIKRDNSGKRKGL